MNSISWSKNPPLDPFFRKFFKNFFCPKKVKKTLLWVFKMIFYTYGVIMGVQKKISKKKIFFTFFGPKSLKGKKTKNFTFGILAFGTSKPTFNHLKSLEKPKKMHFASNMSHFWYQGQVLMVRKNMLKNVPQNPFFCPKKPFFFPQQRDFLCQWCCQNAKKQCGAGGAGPARPPTTCAAIRQQTLHHHCLPAQLLCYPTRVSAC